MVHYSLTIGPHDEPSTMETWLRPNYRPIYVALILPAAGLLVGIALAFGAFLAAGPTWIIGLGIITALASIAGIGSLVRMLYVPRLGYVTGELHVSLGSRQPIAVPINAVECFFLGQGPAMLTANESESNSAETTNVVVRLSEAAEEWKHRTVRPEYGHWCDGYIVIRGTWCEPIQPDLLKRLNQRLVEVHRQQSTESGA